MAIRLSTPGKTEWAIIGVFIAVMIALLVPPIEAVWDGPFLLTIQLNERQPIDHRSLLFATFWREPEAEHALQNPGVYEDSFYPREFSSDGHLMIDVRASGRSGSWGTSGTYNHPRFLVVEYRLDRDNHTLARKVFPIPIGRGARSITIDLP